LAIEENILFKNKKKNWVYRLVCSTICMINVDAYCIYKYMKNDENSTRTTSTILLFHNFLG